MRALLIFLPLSLILLTGCRNNKPAWEADISKIPEEKVSIDNYGRKLFEIDPADIGTGLKQIAPEFPFFLKANLDDTANLIQIRDYITDPKLKELNREVNRQFRDLGRLEKELGEAFRYYRYYFPGKKIPRIYAYISGLQYEDPVIFADSVIVIGLDLFLGRDFETYRQIGLPKYLIRRMEPEFITVSCMSAIAGEEFGDLPVSRTLLDEMIKQGKSLFFLDAMLPRVEDSVKIGYTGRELDWCRENAGNIWGFLIDNRLLYSPDFLVIRKFTLDGPFTAGFGNSSPARLGNWVGWQIVRKYMSSHPEVTLRGLISNTNSQQILAESGYKPER